MSIPISIAIMLISFYIMSRVVDEFFIKSLDNISRWMKLTPSVAGATLMAMGTSAPELSTALFALFLPNTNPATGVGTIVGSAIFQVLVVIGFAALVKTSYLDWKPVIRDGVFYSLTIILLILFVEDDRFTLLESSLLLGTYLIYLIVLFIWTRTIKEADAPPLPDSPETTPEDQSVLVRVFRLLTFPIDWPLSFVPDPSEKQQWTLPVFFGSLATIGFLSYWLVLAAESFALIIGIPPAVVALTILAGGSSIPEMIGSAVVSKQGRGDMAISNAIGSNIFDILISLGLPIFIYNVTRGELDQLGGENIASSILLLFATMLMVLLLLAAQKFRVGKAFGLVLITSYAVYVVAAYAGWL